MTLEATDTEIEEEFDTEPESEDTGAPPEDANSLINLAQEQFLATGSIHEDTLEKLKQINGVTDAEIEEATKEWRANAIDPSYIKFDETFTQAQMRQALAWAEKKPRLVQRGLHAALSNKKTADSTARQLYAEYVSETVAKKPYKTKETGSLKYKGDDLGLEARGRAPSVKQSSKGYDWEPGQPITSFLKEEALRDFGIQSELTQDTVKLAENKDSIRHDKGYYEQKMGKLLDTISHRANSREYRREAQSTRLGASDTLERKLAVQINNPREYF